MKTEFIYQILLKGIISNKLILVSVDDANTYHEIIKKYNAGEYKNILLINTNICKK